MIDYVTKIFNIFSDFCTKKCYDDRSIELVEKGPHLELTISKMYQGGLPEPSFSLLNQIRDLFDAEDVKTDTYYNSGCETCDYGSNNTLQIMIINPKNRPDFKALEALVIFNGN